MTRDKLRYPSFDIKVNLRFKKWFETDGRDKFGLHTYEELASFLDSRKFPVNLSNIKSYMAGDVGIPQVLIKQWKRKAKISYDYILDGKRTD
jgi:hypothetical protein